MGSTVYRYRWAFIPEVDVTRYSGPDSALLEGEQECIPHVVRVLEGMQQRFGVSLKTQSLPAAAGAFYELNELE